ncbi:hypothetical protein I4U23_002659 [Adineta vaga]|nr:hypothetical protein I4U23_002659 [Adineta vaga]
MLNSAFYIPLFFITVLFREISSNELTFELPDNAKDCFHENLKTGSKYVLEFQVVTGGNYDVDLELKSPSGKILYQVTKKQYDQIERTAEEDGVYEFCFSNEFSTYTHKVIYMDWRVDGDPEHEIGSANPRVAEGALTMIESKVGNIHRNLESAIDYQTHHRLREATGRARAEDLQERVQIWSLGQLILVIIVAIDLGTNEDMHGSLLDSHRRSSLSSQEADVVSKSEHLLSEDTCNEAFITVRQSYSPLANNSKTSSIHSPDTTAYKDYPKNSSVHLENVIEDDDEDKQPKESITHSADFFRWTHGHRRVMLTFGTICLFAFMTGVEYAVILPTAFDYVKTMTSVPIYVGLILSSYSISGAITGVIMGKISDMTGKVKILILASNVFEIGGNILYFVTNNIHIVLLGRLIAGVGMGAVPPILADVAHRTTEKDRTKAIAIILGCRQLGLLVGPCFTLLVRKMDFYIGNVHVNNLNGPGFLMASIWLILHIVCWFCFYDRTPSTTTGPSTSNDSPKHKYTRSDHPSRQEQKNVSSKTYREQYIRVEMFVLFFATFIAYFNQTALETIVAAFTEEHFGWNTVHTSGLFAFAGLEIIIVYILLVFVLSKRFEDRFLLVFGFISLTLGCIIGVFFTWASHSFGWSGKSSQGVIDMRLFSMFIVFVILDLLGLPFLAATSVSIFTKLTIKELQGFSQGIQRFIMGIGTIIGPIFAAALLNRLHIMMTTMLVLTVLTLIALFFILKRLRPLSLKSDVSDRNDTNNNILNNSSSIEDENDDSALPLSSKNCYVTLVQHDDEQNESLYNKNSKCNSSSNLDSQRRYDTSSTNVLCLSDEQNRTVENDLSKSSSQIA